MTLDNRRYKRTRRHSKYDETEHHRKPRSLGGKTEQSNISYVARYKHEAWHLLFDNLPANKVLERFKDYWELFGNKDKTKQQIRRDRFWIKNSKPRAKKAHAWYLLWEKKNLVDIINEINHVWIDPDYKFKLVFRYRPEIELSSSRKNL